MTATTIETGTRNLSRGVSQEELRKRFEPIFDQIRQGAVEREINRILPIKEVKKLTEAGFGSLRVPTRYGGEGVGLGDFVGLLIDLAAADSNVAHLFRGHFVFIDDVILTGRESTARTWANRAVNGSVVANASSEQGGQGWWDTSTKIEVRDGRALLNGVKYYSTGSNFSDWILVSAVSPDDEKIGIPVRIAAHGVSVEDDWDGFGQKLTGSGTTRFDDVEVDLAEAISYFSRKPNYLIAYFQLFLLGVQAGIAKAALRDVVEFVRPRKRVFGTEERPLPKDDPQVQGIIGKLAGQVQAIEASVLRAAGELEGLLDVVAAGRVSDDDYYRVENEVYASQSFVSDVILQVTSTFFEVGGASATSLTRVLDRHWRNARTIASHNPVYLRQQILGERLLDPSAAAEQNQ